MTKGENSGAIQDHPLTNHMILGKLLNLPVLLFPYLSSRDYSNASQWVVERLKLIKSFLCYCYCFHDVNDLLSTCHILGVPGSSAGKESSCNSGDPGLIPGLGRSPGEGEATHSSILGLPW